MGKNPLIGGGDGGRGPYGGPPSNAPIPPHGRDDIEAMIRFCHELNYDFDWVRGNRWHYVIPAKTITESHRYAIATGAEGAECWAILERGRIDYHGATAGDLAKATGLAQFRIQHGRIAA